VYGDDRTYVDLGVTADVGSIGRAVVVAEVATALTGAFIGVQPFDQPDVAAAKAATAKVLEEGLPTIASVSTEQLVDQLGPGDYFVLQAFVDPGDEALAAELERVRHLVRDRRKVATTIGIGPRYLHSTGQLHKGGPPTGVFLQVVGDDPVDVPIPGRPYGFSTLKQAQAAGDLLSLRDRGLRAGRVRIDDLREYR
jgi:hypothetical protein